MTKVLVGKMMIMDPGAFGAEVAADLPEDQTSFMAASQRPTSLHAFNTKLPAVAWHDKPSYGIVATEDRILSPDMKRAMYARSKTKVIEVKSSHVPHISQPEIVAQVIRQAAGAR